MKARNKVMAFVMVCLLVVSMIVPVHAKAAENDAFQISGVQGKTVVLHTNDTHGRVEKGTDGSLGMSSVAALKEVLEKAGATVLLLDAGDTLHGKPIATIDQGKTIVSIMNEVGYDAFSLGNHDYNYGTTHLLEVVKDMKFPALAANVIVNKTGEVFTKSHVIIEKNGVKYGIFGLSTEETVTKTNPKNVADVTFLNPVETAKSEVADLKAEGAEVIICLGHIGIDASSDPTSFDIIKAVDGIDLFIDGHSHSDLASCNELNQGTDTLLVSNGEYLQTIGCVVIDHANNNSMKAYTISANELAAAGVKTELAEGEDETAIHAKIGKIMMDAKANLSDKLSEVIGTTSVYLDGEREHVRTTETNLGNLAADALRGATGCDVAFTNGGGIRTSIQVGDITKGMLADVFPFGNIVVTKKVTGKAILEVLEHGVKDYPATSGGYPQVSGITFTINPNKEAGSRISDLCVNGEPIDFDKMYVLASNDFTIAGGDGYTMISDEAFPTLTEYGALDEVLIQYIQTNPSVESYAVGRTKTIALGEEVEETVKETTSVKDTSKEATKTEDKKVEDKKVEDKKVADKISEDKNSSKSNATSKATTYKVVKGDCLSSIAKKLYGKESDWKKIFDWNKATIKNPDMIYIDQELIVYN